MSDKTCPNCGEELTATSSAFRELVPRRFRPQWKERIFNCGGTFYGNGCGRMWVEERSGRFRLFELIKQAWLKARAREMGTIDKDAIAAYVQKLLPDLAPTHVRFSVYRTTFPNPLYRKPRRAKAINPAQEVLFE